MKRVQMSLLCIWLNELLCCSCRQGTPRWGGLWVTCSPWVTCCLLREGVWGRPWPQACGGRSSFSSPCSSPQLWVSFCTKLFLRGRMTMRAPSEQRSLGREIQCSNNLVWCQIDWKKTHFWLGIHDSSIFSCVSSNCDQNNFKWLHCNNSPI